MGFIPCELLLDSGMRFIPWTFLLDSGMRFIPWTFLLPLTQTTALGTQNQPGLGFSSSPTPGFGAVGFLFIGSTLEEGIDAGAGGL